MEKKAKSFVTGAAILAVAGLIVKILGAVYRIPLNNLIGTEGMSFYAVAYPYYSWLLVISSAGLPAAISKLVSERVTRGDYKAAHKVFTVAFRILLIIGVVTTLLMLILSKPLAGMSGLSGASLSFIALAPSLFFVSVMCAYRGYLQGLQQMTGTALSQVAEQLIKLIAGLYFAKLFLPKGPEYAAQGALLGVTVSEFAGLIVIAVFYKIQCNRGLTRQIKQSSSEKKESVGTIVRALCAMAIPITLGASIMPLTGIADSAFILNVLKKSPQALDWAQKSGVVEGAKDAADMIGRWAQSAYSIFRSYVTTIINMPAVLTSALAMSLVPAMSAFIASGKKNSAKNAAVTGLKLALIIGAPCAVGLFVLAEPILLLLYESSLDNAGKVAMASGIMRISAVGVLFLSMVQALTGVIQGIGKPGVPVRNLVLGGIVKVASMLILMRIFNIYGAALSTVLCYAVAAVLDVMWMIRYMHLKINSFDVFAKPVLSAVVMGIYAAFTYSVLGGEGTIATLASICVGVGVYAVLAVLLRMFDENDLGFIPGGKKIAALLYGNRRK
ncbi:MAG: polysaccharide biosynthesis protein [Clostridia bacterium]|nr:polysaccharide biosynthesis protein [Clostridia bacterium]